MRKEVSLEETPEDYKEAISKTENSEKTAKDKARRMTMKKETKSRAKNFKMKTMTTVISESIFNYIITIHYLLLINNHWTDSDLRGFYFFIDGWVDVLRMLLCEKTCLFW